MKKSIITIMLILIVPMIYYFFGIQAENRLNSIMSKIQQRSQSYFQFIEYDKGIFSSTAIIELKGTGEQEIVYHYILDQLGYYPEDMLFHLKLKIFHGPFPFYFNSDLKYPFIPVSGIVSGYLLADTRSTQRLSQVINFKDKALLSILVNLDESGLIKASIPSSAISLNFEQKTIKILWHDITMQSSFSKNLNDFDFNGNIGSIISEGVDYQAGLSKLEMDGQLNLSGEANINMSGEELYMKLISDIKHEVSVNIFAIKADLQSDGKNSNAVVKSQVNRIQLNESQIKEGFFDISLNQFSLEEIKTLFQGQGLNDLMTKLPSDLPTEISDKQLENLKKLLSQFIKPGTELQINRLSFLLNNDLYQADLELELIRSLMGISGFDMKLLNYFNADAGVLIPRSLLMDIVKDQAHQEARNKGGLLGDLAIGSGFVDTFIDNRIRSMEKEKIIISEGPSYRARFKLNKGDFKINGKELSISHFF